jgi:23S rRNA (cytosine1962-C5)-methyltransferase
MEVLVTIPPCVLYEDEALLVVNKPAGLNTHSPSSYAGEGIYEWLRHREARWSKLAIIHRLDKETSGILIFSKSEKGNCSLTDQFTRHLVRKRYFLLTDGNSPRKEITVKSKITRIGEKYASAPAGTKGEVAITTFRAATTDELSSVTLPNRSQIGTPKNSKPIELVVAEPLTGRTHQIRVHAAESGFPVLGDTLYAGSPGPRLYLHSAMLECQNPVTNEMNQFSAHADFAADARQSLRQAFISPALTDSNRLIHGASDGWHGWYVDRFDRFLLAQSEAQPAPADDERVRRLMSASQAAGVYYKRLSRQAGRLAAADASPQHWLGEQIDSHLTVRENGVHYGIRFDEGYSVGLFLDQRDNRFRVLTGHVAAEFDLPAGSLEVLNTFSYTCGFSVCAAKHGARTTSLDLSRKYLDWGKTNFQSNGIDPVGHDFIYGDTLDWLERFRKKQRQFNVVLLDPPTFSQSKVGGTFRVQKDYGKLVAAALGVLKQGGVLFASTNAADWTPEAFIKVIEDIVTTAKRKIVKKYYAPQPLDFPVSRQEPAYLKTIWLQLGD